MNRRRFIGLLLLGAAGVVAAGRFAVKGMASHIRQVRIRRKSLHRADLYKPHGLAG